jgi:hypothetical protein
MSTTHRHACIKIVQNSVPTPGGYGLIAQLLASKRKQLSVTSTQTARSTRLLFPESWQHEAEVGLIGIRDGNGP